MIILWCKRTVICSVSSLFPGVKTNRWFAPDLLGSASERLRQITAGNFNKHNSPCDWCVHCQMKYLPCGSSNTQTPLGSQVVQQPADIHPHSQQTSDSYIRVTKTNMEKPSRDFMLMNCHRLLLLLLLLLVLLPVCCINT